MFIRKSKLSIKKKMVTFKKTIVLSFALIITISIVMSTTKASTIGNPAMKADEPKGCPPGSPQGCTTQPANQYKRGCETGERCRGG